ncbi:MAG: M48 family metalloprotease [Phycisphaerales bacterium]
MKTRLLGVALLALAPLTAPLGGCSTNAATGRSVLTLMSRSEEIKIGSDAAPGFTQEFGGKVAHPGLQQYVADIGRKMAAETESYNPTLPWEFTLLDSDVVNAFALPGGKVFITRGLAKELTSEAQIAGVIGHEIGHVTAQHGNQRISSQMLFNVGLVATAVVVSASDNKTVQDVGAVGVPALAIGGNLVLLKYGRDEELEADALGMRYMTGVGYNPRGQLEVMQTLGRLTGGSGGTPEFLSTHPHSSTRVERIQKALQDKFASTQGNPNYGTFEDRYKRDFLTPLSKLPPPPKAAGPRENGTEHAQAAPAAWCGLCAAAEGNATARAMLASAAMMRR